MHRLFVMTTDLCVTLPERSSILQSVGSPEYALHRPSKRLALKRKSTMGGENHGLSFQTEEGVSLRFVYKQLRSLQWLYFGGDSQQIMELDTW